MQELSAALRNAIDAGNPQRVLLAFDGMDLSNEDIIMGVGITLHEEFNSEEELTIGTCPSSTLSFDLLNDEGQLNEFGFGWFTAYIGARIDSGSPTEMTKTFTENGSTVTYAFAPIGVFYAERPNVINKKKISVTAYDQMVKLERDMPSSTTLGITYPTTVGNICEKITDYLQIEFASPGFLNYDLEVEAEPAEFTNIRFREVIGWIAECACSIARFNRDGALEFAWFTNTNMVYNESNYSNFEQAWYSTQQINGLYVRSTELGSEESNGSSKTNNYLILDNPFLKGG